MLPGRVPDLDSEPDARRHAQCNRLHTHEKSQPTPNSSTVPIQYAYPCGRTQKGRCRSQIRHVRFQTSEAAASLMRVYRNWRPRPRSTGGKPCITGRRSPGLYPASHIRSWSDMRRSKTEMAAAKPSEKAGSRGRFSRVAPQVIFARASDSESCRGRRRIDLAQIIIGSRPRDLREPSPPPATARRNADGVTALLVISCLPGGGIQPGGVSQV